ncbi:MAG: hypothetical protein R3253_13180 [Longimicrobiales bacterium]|nr:hypothetical protein [Longimicrobiales bacterium]
MSWEKKLNCFGYWGFGGGYAAHVEKTHETGGPMYCSSACPLSSECWKRFRERVAEMFPDAMREWEGCLDANDDDGQAAAAEWFEVTGMPPPEITVSGGNMEDGMRVAAGEAPADRGEFTLIFPFPKGHA